MSGRIRQAIAAGEYGEALRLWDEYAAQLRGRLAGGELSGPEIDEAGELLNWSRATLACARAHMMDRLNAAYIARVYTSE